MGRGPHPTRSHQKNQSELFSTTPAERGHSARYWRKAPCPQPPLTRERVPPFTKARRGDIQTPLHWRTLASLERYVDFQLAAGLALVRTWQRVMLHRSSLDDLVVFAGVEAGRESRRVDAAGGGRRPCKTSARVRRLSTMRMLDAQRESSGSRSAVGSMNRGVGLAPMRARRPARRGGRPVNSSHGLLRAELGDETRHSDSAQ